MKILTFFAAFLVSAVSIAAGPPAPMAEVCSEEECTTASRSAGYEFPDIATTASNAPLRAVSTFHNVGLYWEEPTGSGSNEALVRFRKAGSTQWRQGLSLWFDDRTRAKIPYGSDEYRGSLVELDSNSTFEVEVLAVASGKLASTRVTTWNEQFPVAREVQLPENSNSTLNISQSGAAGGYVLYTHAPGRSATIDGRNDLTAAVHISASYVIVRGLTLKNTRNYGVTVGPNAHHVVIEGNDISAFGRPDPVDSRWGCNDTGGIVTSEWENPNLKQLVIQNNRIHHPNYDTNSWRERRAVSPGCGPQGDLWHAAGSSAIYLSNTGGNQVIRQNEIYSDLTHMFDDGIGGNNNFSTKGNVNRDSDIYGNRVSHVWDDAVECEGANQNVRIYGNYTELSMVSIAAAATSIGPLYVFRNVAHKGIRGPEEMSGAGWFFKTRSKSADGTINGINMGGGRAYLFHNTLYRTTESDGLENTLNVDEISVVNIKSRNNIIQARYGVSSKFLPNAFSDFDFNMYPAAQTAWRSAQSHGIASSPAYDSGSSSGKYALRAGTSGHDAGIYIPNFNDDFADGGPDVGAQERGREALRFGVR